MHQIVIRLFTVQYKTFNTVQYTVEPFPQAQFKQVLYAVLVLALVLAFKMKLAQEE